MSEIKTPELIALANKCLHEMNFGNLTTTECVVKYFRKIQEMTKSLIPDDETIEQEATVNVMLNRFNIDSRTGKAERNGFIYGAKWMREKALLQQSDAVEFAEWIKKRYTVSRHGDKFLWVSPIDRLFKDFTTEEIYNEFKARK